MTTRLLHGLLLGALLASVSLFLELWGHYQGYAYHHDYAFYWTWLPEYALAGALLGLLSSGLANALTNQRKLLKQQGLHLSAWVISGATLLVFGLQPEAQPMVAWATGIAASVPLYWLLCRYARSRWAWVMSGFTTPWFCVLALAGVFGTGAINGYLGADSWKTPAGWPQSAQSEKPAYPNVLLVVLDGVGARHLGCYGYHRSTSPELDRIAGEGVIFENTYAASSWSLPSHASLLSGLHQSSHGAGWENLYLADGAHKSPGISDAFTLAEALSTRNFQTCGISSDPYLNADHGTSQGFEYYFDLHDRSIPDRLFLARWLDSVGASPRQHAWQSSSQQAVSTALSWLKQPRLRDPQQPFFLFLHLEEACAPYRLPKEFADATRFLPAGTDPASLTAAHFGEEEQRHLFHQGKRELVPEEAVIQKALYDASILYLDGQIQRLMEGLREQALLEDTLVVFTSSHGEEFHEQGRFGHQFSLSDRILQVPLIMRMPRLLPAGQRVNELVSLVDVAPTVLGVLNQELEQPPRSGQLLWEGFDFVPVIQKQQTGPRDWVLAEYQNPARLLLQKWSSFSPAQTPRARSITALRTNSGKFFRFGDGSSAFLELAQDPDENAAERPGSETQAGGLEEAYSLRLQRLLNWLKTRRTVLEGVQVGPAERVASTLAKETAQTLTVPAELLD
jgi:arylsulfatase A-like enzyme